MKSGARTLTDGIQAADAGLSVQIYFDAAAKIVCGRGYGNVLFGDVDADAEAFLIDIREVLLGFFGIFVGNIQIDMLVAALLHLRQTVGGHCPDSTFYRHSLLRTRWIIQHFIRSQGSGMESIGFVLRRKNANSISTILPNLPLKRETYQHL